ncbi:DUF6246 family protein [Pantoea ananatis]|uniref:DUF6246 family protein n=1 Tax=Pantoea ananas TaxID=553 RepID=UPI0023B1F69F|nr:DUF6246 family protein [Pantoea ananatis]
MSETAQLPIPAKLAPLFTATGKRYRCSHGGRGSAKTRTFALMTAVKAYQAMMNGESGVILCAREFMNSLEESSMQEVKQAILSVPWLAANFDMGENYIRTTDRSVRYVFAGLRHNLDSIKSKARILLCWVDEAESVSETAWTKLTPTVREEDSEIWVTWNPERDGSATDKRFRKSPGDDCITVEMNYSDNAFGSLPTVIASYALRPELRTRKLMAAMSIIQACCDRDVTRLTGEIVPARSGRRAFLYRPGALSFDDMLLISQSLITHGIIGKAQVRRLQKHEGSGTSSEFNAFEYISAARAHLGMSREEAEQLTMTDFQMMLSAKYPEQKGFTREEYNRVADNYLARRARRETRKKINV